MADRYAVIGNPIAHSRSPAIHARFAAATGQDIVYERLLAPVGGFAEAALRFRAEGGRGLNVTLPFKLDAFALATERSARAEAAGAVNLLAFDGERIFGDNTDGAGLVRDVEVRLGVPLAGRSVLLLGAGGAARGVIRPLLDAGATRVAIANRTAARARELATGLGDARVAGCGFDEVGAMLDGGGPFDLLVNATSTGLGGEALPVPGALFAAALLAYDMVYAAAPTRFMAQAEAGGCPRVSDGLGMLIEQAAESFLVWRGVRPDTAPVYAALRAELAAEAAR
ncbi:shikimate dehydrogenase [Burkholderiaceae bacterium FT117]|uniref:shikimate dehydrogenase n=1 Tax=Zeimonas sediminis TaxID=2944268 RepID=UPI00234317ED|nr:shikimate dehydrogenase [Zeimonas sediminis]MCM5570680.1 shikimate dehydrogenase [Zeimonas sediminis]